MRIAFTYDAPYPWHVGGIEMLNYNEAEELAKGNDVHYYTMRWPGMESAFAKSNITYHAWHRTDQGRLYRHGRRSIREAIAYSISLARLFAHRYDVVITNAFPILHLPIVKLYCRLYGAKLIVEVAEVWDREYWETYLGGMIGGIAYSYANNAIRNADFYVTISSSTSDKLVELGIERSRTAIFAPAIDMQAMAVTKAGAARQKTVIFSGRLIKEKRLDRWLGALKAASKMDPGINGVVIGKGPERRGLEAMTKRMGLSDRVELRDFYEDRSDLYKKIKESALTLQMSEREGLSIMAIESIALGTPVVLPSDTPLPKEVKEMCVVVDEDKIPAKIVEIAKSKDKSRYIRNRGNIGLYSKSKVCEFYSALFKKLR